MKKRTHSWIVAATLVGLTGAGHAGDVKLLRQPGTFPLVIATSGSYRLKSNIVVPDANTTAIEITADDVTLDLNGYTIKGPTVCSGFPASVTCTPTGTGIGISSSADSVTIHDGTVRGMGSRAILLNGRNAVVERVRARSNGSSGIHVNGEGCRVASSMAAENNSAGIVASQTCVVTGNVARLNGGEGIHADDGSIVTGNTAYDNDGSGIEIAGVAIVMGNVVASNFNGIDGMSPGGFGTASDNAVYANDDAGIIWEGVISNNYVTANGSEGVAGHGLVTGNAVQSNTLAGISIGTSDGYSNNLVNNNNGGNGNPQIENGIEIAGNVCGADISCP
jgi:hypothetical protein